MIVVAVHPADGWSVDEYEGLCKNRGVTAKQSEK